MRIQVLFNETSVLVPCGDGSLTVKDLVDKAIVRFKKVLNKHQDDVIEVRSLRMADTSAFISMDDEVADVLEDKEVVILDFEFIPHYIRDTTGPNPDLEEGIAYSSSIQNHTSYSSGLQLHEPIMSSLPNVEENFDRTDHIELGIANGDHPSLQSGSLEHLDDVDPTATPTSLHMGVGGASQDIEMVTQRWDSQNSGSPDPNSPHLVRKTDWRTSSDTGYATSKSQESYTQSQPKSQETFHHTTSEGLAFTTTNHNARPSSEGLPFSPTNHSGSEGLPFSPTNHSSSEGLPFSSTNHSSSEGLPSFSSTNHTASTHEHGKFPSHRHTDHTPMDHTPMDRTSMNHTPINHTPMDCAPMDFSGKSSSIADNRGHTPNDEGVHVKEGHIKASSYGHHDDRFHHGSQDFSPNMPHPPHHPNMPPDFLGRSFDFYRHSGYGYPLPSLDEGGGGYDKRYYDHMKRRAMTMYGNTGEHYHPGSQFGATPPGGLPGRHMMNHYGGRPGYPEFYDPRMPPGRFGRPHDPHFTPRLNRSYSHERMDGTPPSSLPGGMRPHPHPLMNREMGRGGMEEEFHSLPPEMFLSQPTTGYFNSYDQPPPPAPGGGYGGVPMVSHMFGDRVSMGGPSSGVSLSQPGMMISHRPGLHSMIDLERYHSHLGSGPLVGGVYNEKSSQGKASIKSADSLDRRVDNAGSLSVEEQFELDPGGDEEGEGQPKGRNPFQRDFRKSMLHNGNMYAQWMERMDEQELEENNDVPLFDGEADLVVPPGDPAHEQSPEEEEEESGEEDDEYGNVHIVELHKLGESLGIQLTHYTSPEGIDVGVYIAVMDAEGFAAKSGKLQVQDRILACNGCDFTKDIPNSKVEEIFSEMISEPLLRLAISRGGFKGNLQSTRDRTDVGVAVGEVGVASEGVVPPLHELEGIVANGDENWVESPIDSRRVIKAVAPPSAPSQAPSLALTNTRQIGSKHTIQLQRGGRGFGFGLTSRDVKTVECNQPIYVKTVQHGGPAYQDGRLRIGDRILEVNGVDVAGLGRPDVVQLLRDSQDTVILVISRQEVDDEEVEEPELKAPPTPGDAPSVPMTVIKTVFDLEIPLHNSGPAGLGVTVYTKTTSAKGAGEIGVYIKSIVAGGAAALDGRLHKNDQVLSVNKHNLLGHSNQEAMEILKQAMSNQNTVHLVVARRTTPTSHSMPSVGEEPEEEEENMEHERNEVGIDVPSASAIPPHVNTLTTGSPHSLRATSSAHNLPVGGGSGPLSSLQLQTSLEHSSHDLSSQTSLTDVEPSRGSIRSRAATMPSNTSPRLRPLNRSQDLLGSGEFYDRLEPLPSDNSVPAPITATHPTFSHFSSLYEEVGTTESETSLDIRGMSRHSDHTSSTLPRSYPPQMSREPNPASSRHPLSPSDIDLQLFSPSGSNSSRDNSLPRQQQRKTSHDSHASSSNPSDSTHHMGHVGVAADAPVRGSGRKDRNRPERGSGRSHTHQVLGGVSASPELHANGYATLPRASSHHGDVGGATGLDSVASLENLRLADSESNSAFRRDNPGRISITKKTKKNPREDFAHLRYQETSPMVEGEKQLVRTGSDGCLSEHSSMHEQGLMQTMQIGPSLGLAKSSSLESLHNVMHHTIQRDIVDDGSSRSTRNSFRRSRGMDHSFEDGDGEQRGVDVDFALDSSSSMPAMISFTKSPHTSKAKKKGFFQKVFKKRKTIKKDKSSPENTRKARSTSTSMEISPASLTSEERDQLMRHYTLQLRPLSQAVGPSSGTSALGLNSSSLPSTSRHSMSALDDYDSPDSPDEVLLASMAKV